MNDEAVEEFFDLVTWPIFSAVIVLALTGNFGLSAALLMAFGVLGYLIK